MDADPPSPGPVNLGNPEELTILELAEMALEVTGSRSRPVCKPLPVDDARRRCPDIALARVGLERTAAFFERELALAHAS